MIYVKYSQRFKGFKMKYWDLTVDKLSDSTLYFMRIIKQYLESGGKDLSVPDFAPEADFEEILRIAHYNNCDAFVYHMVRDWCADYGLDSKIFQYYKKKMLSNSLLQMRANAELRGVIDMLHTAGVKFMLLKGVLLAELYPNTEYRRSCDADIFIATENFRHVADLLEARGYVHIVSAASEHEQTFTLDDILSIDLHTRLFGEFYEKNRSAIHAAEFESQSSVVNVEVIDRHVDTLSPSISFVYVLCHHSKHFVKKGINFRQLIDICLFVNKYGEQLDWDYILSALDRFSLKNFILILLYICKKYIGLIDLPFLYSEIDEGAVQLLLYDIVERNSSALANLERASTEYLLRAKAYYSGSKTSFNLRLASYFPSVRALSFKYQYAKKHPVLLPIAWIHRACHYLSRKLGGKERIITSAERVKLAGERVELLRRVGIL